MCVISNYKDYQYFNVNPDGTQTEIETFEADNNKVYIIVDHKARIITLWKGETAPVRLKFIGSRASGDARKEFGFHYKNEVMDQGDESESFKERILGGVEASTGATGVASEGGESTEHMSYAEMAAKQGVSVSDDEIRQAAGPSHSGSPVSKMGGVGARPQASFLAQGFEGLEGPVTKKDIQKVFQTDTKAEAKKILDELGSPSGYTREMVALGDEVYRVVGADNDVEFQELDNPLDGIILVKDYTPRIIAESGKIKVIELLRRTSDEIEEDEVMTQDLADLTSMFMIDIGE